MHCIGIIAEYNPFHNGHARQIRLAKEAAGGAFVVAAMSPHFMQRGEPALLDKWTRTRMALAGGADLVLELPTAGAISSSEGFAETGVRLLASSGVVTHLSFGSETTDLTLLQKAAETALTEPPAFKKALEENLSQGMGFAAARSLALAEAADISEVLLHKPNTILAIEYLKALHRLDADMIPLPILRETSYHDSLHPEAPSASKLRDLIRTKADVSLYMPNEVIHILRRSPMSDPFDTWGPLLYDRLLHHTPTSLAGIRDVSEGLENRILQAIDRPMPISEAVERISTKRYPKARIRRILLNILLEMDAHLPCTPQYIRVLGFRRQAESLLSEMIQKSSLPVITNPAKAQDLLLPEAFYTDLYLAHVAGTEKTRGREWTEPLIKY
ncbi:MAG: nucleotidyltransferase family protein [Clostridiales bacterium]|nr:nucleotidyltransferase family protein [Clostridiales bacterium]